MCNWFKPLQLNALRDGDIEVIWPSSKAAIILAAYITQCSGPESKRSAFLLAEIGSLVAKSLA